MEGIVPHILRSVLTLCKTLFKFIYLVVPVADGCRF